MILPQIGLGQEFYLGAFSIPPSPESSSLIRNVNVPIDKYTGAANIQVPLYMIETQDISIPVMLTYQSSGIKVQDVATWVGLGWNLSAGGRITRIVRHFPDEMGYSDPNNSHWNQIQDLGGWDRNNFESRLKNMDTEPDVFFFEIPGRSGMFVVDASGNAHTIPYQKLKIEWINRSVFKITDEMGVVYKFYTEEVTESTVTDDGVSKTFTFTSSWYLDEIRTVKGRSISFVYDKGNSYEFYNYNKRYILKFHDIGDHKVEINQQKDQNVLIKIKEPKYLNRINWDGNSLVFESNEERWDLPGGRRLTGIRLETYSNQKLKSIVFSYSTFSKSKWRPLHEALKLDKIEEVTCNGDKRMLNEFQYNDSLLPRGLPMYDHWGYANETRNPSAFHPNFVCRANGTGYLYGVSREVDTVRNQYGILKRIYYTKESFKEFEYETNRALVNGFEKLQGGLRIKRIKEYESNDAEPLVTSFYYLTTSGKSSGRAFTNNFNYLYPIYYGPESMKILGTTQYYNAYYFVAYDQPILSPYDLNGASVGYAEVKEVLPNGSWNIYKFITSDESPDEDHKTYYLYQNRYEGTCLFSPNSSNCWARGLIDEISTYNAQGENTSRQKYTYKKDLRASDEIVAYIPFYWGEGMKIGNADLRLPYIAIYKWFSQPMVMSSVSISGTDVLSETISYTYSPDYLVIKSETVTDVMNNIYKKTYTYPFDYTVNNASNTNINAYALKIMNQKHMINYPVEVTEYKDNMIIGGTINEYKCLRANFYRTEAPVMDKIKQLFLTEPVTSLNPYHVGGYEDSKYKVTRYFDSYDEYGRLLQFHDQDKDTISYVYDLGDNPIAEIYNAACSEEEQKSEVYFTDFERNLEGNMVWAKSGRRARRGPGVIFINKLKPGTYNMSYWKSTDGGKTWNKIELQLTKDAVNPQNQIFIGDKSCYIDDVLIVPAKARVKSCTYIGGIGKTSETDFNGNTTYYEYDGFGRLSAVYDNDRNLITRYFYHDAVAN